MISKI